MTKLASTFSDIIIAKTDWIPLNQLPTGRGPIVRDMKYRLDVTGAGVYQIALKSSNPSQDDIVQKDIGYTGRAANVFNRVGGLKTGKHNAGKMIAEQNYKFEDVIVRYLFTKDGDEQLLETKIHNETQHLFNYTFKWRKASGGTDGISTRILQDIDKIENPAELTEIIRRAKEHLASILIEAAMDGTLQSLASDYFDSMEE